MATCSAPPHYHILQMKIRLMTEWTPGAIHNFHCSFQKNWSFLTDRFFSKDIPDVYITDVNIIMRNCLYYYLEIDDCPEDLMIVLMKILHMAACLEDLSAKNNRGSQYADIHLNMLQTTKWRDPNRLREKITSKGTAIRVRIFQTWQDILTPSWIDIYQQQQQIECGPTITLTNAPPPPLPPLLTPTHNPYNGPMDFKELQHIQADEYPWNTKLAFIDEVVQEYAEGLMYGDQKLTPLCKLEEKYGHLWRKLPSTMNGNQRWSERMYLIHMVEATSKIQGVPLQQAAKFWAEKQKIMSFSLDKLCQFMRELEMKNQFEWYVQQRKYVDTVIMSNPTSGLKRRVASTGESLHNGGVSIGAGVSPVPVLLNCLPLDGDSSVKKRCRHDDSGAGAGCHVGQQNGVHAVHPQDLGGSLSTEALNKLRSAFLTFYEEMMAGIGAGIV